MGHSSRFVRCLVLGFVIAASVASRNAAADQTEPQPSGAPPPLPSPLSVPVASPSVQEPPASVPCGPTVPCAPAPDRTEKVPTPYNPNDGKLLHGFRIGYDVIMNYDKPVQAFDGQSLQQKTGMRSPNHFLLGYEAFYRMVGHSWLNVILVANANVSGLEEGNFFPSGNLLLGGEFNNSFQAGVGVHLEPLKGAESHVIIAAGWTPRVGTFYVPVHAFFIPDVDGVNRMGLTTGVTW
jgi:hypothetical protein